MPNDTSDQRLVALESVVARLEETLDELSDVVRRQGEEIDSLHAAVKVIGRERLAETEGEAEPHIHHKVD